MDLGHVSIYRGLVDFAGLDAKQEKKYFELLQSKAVTELNVWAESLNLKDEVILEVDSYFFPERHSNQILTKANSQLRVFTSVLDMQM